MQQLVNLTQLNITNEQAVKFARSIYQDINSFINENTEEYQEWLKQKYESEENL